ncbi:PepSY-associated TM helix domain-containing protein [Nevskia ramosa]|uniref:PepSY-associated TM helix domain-containing protein n=1 Tax=Nevskia ramosa TaxID=64002 RepID=UPI0003B76899|nr:PepSY-associated TM helix domain-containing protein [Nevskia ramosa]
MFQNFRLSMTWLHTWFGLLLGFVLMVAFFFGSLSVFDREIDRWAIPATRIEARPMPSFDTALEPIFRTITDPDPDELAAAKTRVSQPLPDKLTVMTWSAFTTHRDPVLRMFVEFEVPNSPLPDDHIHGSITIDPRDGKQLPENRLAIGSAFFYPMHFSLHLTWADIGYWIVGFAALAMLAALVSGVIMHRKIFREFFTFRPNKKVQRSTLDLHNLSGVVALPFHFLWALSGLIIFAGLYFPVLGTMMRPLAEAQEKLEATQTGLDLEPSGTPGTLASVDGMVAEAKAMWVARGVPGEVGFLIVHHVGSSNAYVSVYRDNTDQVGGGPGLHFQGSTGKLIHEDPPEGAVSAVNSFLVGMHLQRFKHWTLRWLIFAGGILSSVCIVTGFVFFVEKRKRQHSERRRSGARWADALAVTTVTGMVVATLAILVANRLLPEDLAQRDLWEKSSFWAAWMLCLVHAIWRSSAVLKARTSPAWAEQCWTIVVLAIGAVVLNAVTTGDHLFKTLSEAYWPVAGTDLMLLACAALAAIAARRLQRRATAVASAAADDQDEELREARHA